MLSMTTPRLLTCEEGDIALLSMNKEKQLDLDKTDLVPIVLFHCMVRYGSARLGTVQYGSVWVGLRFHYSLVPL